MPEAQDVAELVSQNVGQEIGVVQSSPVDEQVARASLREKRPRVGAVRILVLWGVFVFDLKRGWLVAADLRKPWADALPHGNGLCRRSGHQGCRAGGWEALVANNVLELHVLAPAWHMIAEPNARLVASLRHESASVSGGASTIRAARNKGDRGFCRHGVVARPWARRGIPIPCLLSVVLYLQHGPVAEERLATCHATPPFDFVVPGIGVCDARRVS
ncbi:hypothetical protein Trco_002248 [Trichoderma cornu-damae]|uniref:Uncharacterized protein n=1 Tax=Trichoderma cornu-damae TaxID=654480 RepID=A0A9P8TYA7_9HYPO|nr:hypothetical protein Trco_002248 [Trichoderma cornu-damae]